MDIGYWVGCPSLLVPLSPSRRWSWARLARVDAPAKHQRHPRPDRTLGRRCAKGAPPLRGPHVRAASGANVSRRSRVMTSLHDSARCEHDWVGFCRKCYVARIARPAPRLRARGLFGPCDLARRLPTAASIGQIPVPPCCLGVLLAVVLPAVCLFSRILPC